MTSQTSVSNVSTLSTHVLDAAYGVPAVGLDLVLRTPDGGTRDAVTDGDGRFRFADPVDEGEHTLVFATGPWFAASDRATFFPEVQVAFSVSAGPSGAGHHHVALLLSPYSYTTYRGS